MTAISVLASSSHQENVWLSSHKLWVQPGELHGSGKFTLLWPSAIHFIPEVTVTGLELHMCPMGVERAVLLRLWGERVVTALCVDLWICLTTRGEGCTEDKANTQAARSHTLKNPPAREL